MFTLLRIQDVFFKAAKIWLEPDIEVARKGDFTEKEMREIVTLVQGNKILLLNKIDKIKKTWKE